MKKIAFDISCARWDQYQEFHMHLGGNFVYFKTGELVWTNRYIDMDYRREYRELGITATATDHRTMPHTYMPDGTPVPAAWLNQGGSHGGNQCVIYDHASGRVVATSPHDGAIKPYVDDRSGRTFHAARLPGIPLWLRGIAEVYWPGPGEPPVGWKIRLNPPKVYTPEEKDWMKQTTAACKAYHQLKPGELHYRDAPVNPTGLFGKDFADLPENLRRCIAVYGWEPIRETLWVDYLTVNRDA